MCRLLSLQNLRSTAWTNSPLLCSPSCPSCPSCLPSPGCPFILSALPDSQAKLSTAHRPGDPCTTNICQPTLLAWTKVKSYPWSVDAPNTCNSLQLSQDQFLVLFLLPHAPPQKKRSSKKSILLGKAKEVRYQFQRIDANTDNYYYWLLSILNPNQPSSTDARC